MPYFQGLMIGALAFFLAAVITPIVLWVAKEKGLYDIPERRKVHSRPIPRLGGIAIFLATWSCWGLFTYYYPSLFTKENASQYWALFEAATLVWLLGLYDDLRGAGAFKKLVVQVIAACWVVYHGVGIKIIFSPLTGANHFIDQPWVIALLSIFWIVGITNAINLIDGLDGLAGGVCTITSLSIFFISRDLGITHLPFFLLILAGACLGFLIYNFSPARIFLGDSGSLFLGFVLASVSIMGTVKRSAFIVMFGPPVILALPVADTILAIVRRFLKTAASHGDLSGYRQLLKPKAFIGRLREVFTADQGHIHHGLVKIGLSHRRAVIILYFVTAVLGFTAYRIAVYSYIVSTLLTLGLLGLALAWMLRKVKKVQK